MKFVTTNEIIQSGIYLCRHPQGNLTFENINADEPSDSNCQWHGPLTDVHAYDLYRMLFNDEEESIG